MTPASPIDVITDRDRIDLADVVAVLAHAPWARNRDVSQVERILRNSDALALAKRSSTPVGFARAVTDRAVRAFLEDVVVIPEARNRGIGTLMVRAIESQVRAFGIDRLELTTTQEQFWSRLGYSVKDSTLYMVKYL